MLTPHSVLVQAVLLYGAGAGTLLSDKSESLRAAAETKPRPHRIDGAPWIARLLTERKCFPAVLPLLALHACYSLSACSRTFGCEALRLLEQHTRAQQLCPCVSRT